ncbi:hypothetical protein [Magnetovirga frankeli]
MARNKLLLRDGQCGLSKRNSQFHLAWVRRWHFAEGRWIDI